MGNTCGKNTSQVIEEEERVTREENTRFIVTRLIDSWNNGMKEGFIDQVFHDKEAIRKCMLSLGITIYLENQEKGCKFFIMKTRDIPDHVQNPFVKA
jgi:hypothetical protein